MILFLTLNAQENIPFDQRKISDFVNDADLIVLGTFRGGFPFPWFDGWHYQSKIDVLENILPTSTPSAVTLAWIRPYGRSCLKCDDWRKLDGKAGIWFLRQREGALTIFGGSQPWCDGPVDLRYLNYVRNVVRDKTKVPN